MDIFADPTPLHLAVAVVLSIALSAAVCRWLLHETLAKQEKPPLVRIEKRYPKESALRVDVVPLDTTREALEIHLRSLAVQHPDLREAADSLTVRSLAQKSDRFSCATVTIKALIYGDELARRLQRSCEDFSYRIDCSFHGITPLSDGEECDIIAVSGLASHPIGSWKARQGNDVWLRDWLPEDIPNTRVLLYGYNTTLMQNESKLSIEDLARSFLVSLTAFRKNSNSESRPIIFIGHSLGGLLIKDALVQAYRGSDTVSPYKILYTACRGLLFFGVPNQGLRNECLTRLVNGQPNRALVDSIVVDNDSEPSDFLTRLSNDFSKCFQDRRLFIVCFYERRLSPTVEINQDGTLQRTGPLALMVTRKSATATGLVDTPDEDTIPVDADHSALVKFESRGQDTYIIVKERIRGLVSNKNLPFENPSEQQATNTATSFGKDVTITQHGSTVSGSIKINGGSFTQGNVVKLR